MFLHLFLFNLTFKTIVCFDHPVWLLVLVFSSCLMSLIPWFVIFCVGGRTALEKSHKADWFYVMLIQYYLIWCTLLLLENRLMVPAVHLVPWPSPSFSLSLVLLDQSKLFMAEVLVLEADYWHHAMIHWADGTLHSVHTCLTLSSLHLPSVLFSPLNHLVLNYANCWYAAWFDGFRLCLYVIRSLSKVFQII